MRTASRKLILVLIVSLISAFYFAIRHVGADSHSSDIKTVPAINKYENDFNSQMESALYLKTQFFDAQALVPYPTAEARNRLIDLAKKYPNEPSLFYKLSQLEEQLGNYTPAENALHRYIELTPSSNAMEKLADFYHERAQFLKEAETLEKILFVPDQQDRPQAFKKLIESAKIHKLDKYTSPQFYHQVIEKDPSLFVVVDKYIEDLKQEKNYSEALKIIHEYKDRYPDRKRYFLQTEVSILSEMGKIKDAEAIYIEAFDPFWPDEIGRASCRERV